MTKEEITIIERLDNIQRLTVLAAKKVLGIEDVAILTGLSKSHIYRMTSEHLIPHYKPSGKMIYFDRDEIESWMKTNRVATTTEIEQAALAYCVTGKHAINKGAVCNI